MIWECFARRTPYLSEIEAGTLKIRTQWELQTHIINGVRPSMDFEKNGMKMPDGIKVRASRLRLRIRGKTSRADFCMSVFGVICAGVDATVLGRGR